MSIHAGRCVAVGNRLAEAYGTPEMASDIAADVLHLVGRTGLEPEQIERVLVELNWDLPIGVDARPRAGNGGAPRFYLGVHMPHWLAVAGVPLFVSHRGLSGRRTLPLAAAPWALDSGGFTELTLHGRWETSPAVYAAAVRRYRDEIGSLEWASPQDWMCEPVMVERTGLTVQEHQERTVANYLELKALAPDLPFIPVLQGWRLADYHACVEMYDRAGVDLRAEPLVGLGSVCRRQATSEIETIVRSLARGRLRLHGFGVKALGFSRYAEGLASADSMAWSFDARRSEPMPGHAHKNCANCLPYALQWRRRLLKRLEQTQMGLPIAEVA